MQQLAPRLEQFFSRRGLLNYLLLPLSMVFSMAAWMRCKYYHAVLKQIKAPIIVVVGNLSVGGSGKTPTVIALTRALVSRGYRVGIISRGYGGAENRNPQLVTSKSLPKDVGDEPVMMARALDVPVVICRDRVRALERLQQHTLCDVVLSDDGLQHYRLPRDIEVICINQHAIGNRFCLPAGPLREPMTRLKSTDFILSDEADFYNTTKKRVVACGIYHLKSHKKVDIRQFHQQEIVAVSGIAYPERFYKTLSSLGLVFKRKVFPDHYTFCVSDFRRPNNCLYVMTEKDAVKCQTFNLDNLYYLKIDVCIPRTFLDRLENRIEQLRVDRVIK